MFFAIIDLETEGLALHKKPLQIAALKIDPEGNHLDIPIARYIKWPGYDIDPKAFDVHGLTPEFLDCRGYSIDSVDADLSRYLGHAESVVILNQNPTFDKDRIDRWFPSLSGKLSRRCFDLQALSFLCWPEKQVGLSKVAERFGLKQAEPHDALTDVLLAADVYRIYKKALKFAFNLPTS